MTTVTPPEPGSDAVLANVVGLVDAARHASARAVNALIAAETSKKVQMESGLFAEQDGMAPPVRGASPDSPNTNTNATAED